MLDINTNMKLIDAFNQFEDKYPEINQINNVSDLCSKYPELNNRSKFFEVGNIYLFRVGSKNDWILGLFLGKSDNKIDNQSVMNFMPLWDNKNYKDSTYSFLENWIHTK